MKDVRNNKEISAAREGKPRLHLVPPLATRAVARVMEFGASKHGDYNYRNCTDYRLYLDAAMRHLNEQVQKVHEDGQDGPDFLAMDKESGLPSLAHAVASAMIALELYMVSKGIDDV